MGMMPNLYRAALVAHQTTAKTYHTDMCGLDGASNPCSGVIKAIEDGAWVSPAADEWCEKADTLGRYIKDVFEKYYSETLQEYIDKEPEEVDDSGEDAWKAEYEDGRTEDVGEMCYG